MISVYVPGQDDFPEITRISNAAFEVIRDVSRDYPINSSTVPMDLFRYHFFTQISLIQEKLRTNPYGASEPLKACQKKHLKLVADLAVRISLCNAACSCYAKSTLPIQERMRRKDRYPLEDRFFSPSDPHSTVGVPSLGEISEALQSFSHDELCRLAFPEKKHRQLQLAEWNAIKNSLQKTLNTFIHLFGTSHGRCWLSCAPLHAIFINELRELMPAPNFIRTLTDHFLMNFQIWNERFPGSSICNNPLLSEIIKTRLTPLFPQRDEHLFFALGILDYYVFGTTIDLTPMRRDYDAAFECLEGKITPTELKNTISIMKIPRDAESIGRDLLSRATFLNIYGVSLFTELSNQLLITSTPFLLDNFYVSTKNCISVTEVVRIISALDAWMLISEEIPTKPRTMSNRQYQAYLKNTESAFNKLEEIISEQNDILRIIQKPYIDKIRKWKDQFQEATTLTPYQMTSLFENNNVLMLLYQLPERLRINSNAIDGAFIAIREALDAIPKGSDYFDTIESLKQHPLINKMIVLEEVANAANAIFLRGASKVTYVTFSDVEFEDEAPIIENLHETTTQHPTSLVSSPAPSSADLEPIPSSSSTLKESNDTVHITEVDTTHATFPSNIAAGASMEPTTPVPDTPDLEPTRRQIESPRTKASNDWGSKEDDPAISSAPKKTITARPITRVREEDTDSKREEIRTQSSIRCEPIHPTLNELYNIGNKTRVIIRWLEKHGATFVRQAGSHKIYTFKGKTLVIPEHEELKPGTRMSIFKTVVDACSSSPL